MDIREAVLLGDSVAKVCDELVNLGCDPLIIEYAPGFEHNGWRQTTYRAVYVVTENATWA